MKKERTEVFNCYTVDIHTDLLEIHSYFIVAHSKKEAVNKALSKFSKYDDGKIIKIKVHH
jgi:hypothetical protein